jgi:hypothetical protein
MSNNILELPSDLQKIICDFLNLREINTLYCSSKSVIEMLKILGEHNNFTVVSKVILTTQLLDIFKLRNIKVRLVKTEKYELWYNKNGELHRDNDLPAIIYTNGSKGWYKNGNLHREDDLPAMIGNGEEYWFKEGRLHRDNDLPALTRPNGTQLYFKYGVRYIPVTIQ